MLGCGYDDLFQRHKRRQRRRLIISLSSVMMLFVVAISTLIYFNLKISASEQKYRANLMDSYVNTGNERAAEGKMQEALACYVKVLKDMPEHKKAKQGALLILQLFEWIYQEDSSSQVSFPEDDPIYGESQPCNNDYRSRQAHRDSRCITRHRCRDIFLFLHYNQNTENESFYLR